MQKDIRVFIFKIPKRLPRDISFLQQEELQKYVRMSSEKRKREFLYGRLILSSILKEIYNIQNAKIKLKKSGKPYVRGLKFSMSHSGGYIAIAIHPRIELGIDIEVTNKIKHARKIAEKYFSPKELQYIFASKEALQRFKVVWSLKEAYIKAIGSGLSSESIKVYFDLKNKQVESHPSTKKITCFYNKKWGLSVCALSVVKKIRVDRLTFSFKTGLKVHPLSTCKLLKLPQ